MDSPRCKKSRLTHEYETARVPAVSNLVPAASLSSVEETLAWNPTATLRMATIRLVTGCHRKKIEHFSSIQELFFCFVLYDHIMRTLTLCFLSSLFTIAVCRLWLRIINSHCSPPASTCQLLKSLFVFFPQVLRCSTLVDGRLISCDGRQIKCRLDRYNPTLTIGQEFT